MKTPMNVMTSLKKKRKNQKGFSLVELIVVLVIMAILAAALIPSLTGYIRQTRQSNAKNEASSCVSAAQTIASSAFADPAGNYAINGVTINFTKDCAGSTGTDAYLAQTEALAEIPSGANIDSIKVDDLNGKVSAMVYKTANGQTVEYNGSTGAYTVDKNEASE